jgi:hypothetical protein
MLLASERKRGGVERVGEGVERARAAKECKWCRRSAAVRLRHRNVSTTMEGETTVGEGATADSEGRREVETTSSMDVCGEVECWAAGL